jgi:cyanoexosortase A
MTDLFLSPKTSSAKTSLARWPLWTGGGLVGLHLVLVFKVTGNPDQWLLSLLFWGAIVTQLRRPWPRQLRPALWTRGLGLLVLGLLMLKSWHLNGDDTAFVRLFPLVAFGGWSLMVRGWRQRSWGLVWGLVVALSIPPRALPWLLETIADQPLRTTTAAVAAFGLHYLGFDVVRQGSLIQLPVGTVDVEFACTGAALLGLLLQMSVLIAAMTDWQSIGNLWGGSVAIAALLSTIRVAIMAAVVGNEALFQFWHGANGGQIFTVIALATLACWGFREHHPNDTA